MAEGRWRIKDENEGISERWVITGRLVLESPAHIGNGEVSQLTDMPLLLDPLAGKALLTGASIAGALRNYLQEYERGYNQMETKNSRSALLFGSQHNKAGYASLLVIDDALGQAPDTELRDGVGIDSKTRTAKENVLYNMELLPSGVEFELRFELSIPVGQDGGRFEKDKSYRDELLESLAVALYGLQSGQIRLGRRKRRGLGRCRVTEWRAKKYEMNQTADLLAWLERPVEGIAADADPNIQMLLPQTTLPPDHRDYLELKACFALTTSLLIRSESGVPADPDVTHLRSNGRPILSGTSLAGAMRARALRIANTLKIPQADDFVTGIFGGEIKRSGQKELVASRLIVDETIIKHGLDMVQSRVKIDRFTGGAFPGALFSEQPVFGTPETAVQISARLVAPTPAEIGLILMLLKDLWTGDLPLGGEAGIGRGRLAGRDASLTYQGQTWSINQPPGQALAVDSATRHALQPYADALKGIAQ